MMPAKFHLYLPESISCGAVFSSPHSGRDYPSSFLSDSVLDELTIRSSEDAFVDELFRSAPEQGAPLLAACAPRVYVDLNRRCDELDPALIEGVRQIGSNSRVASGLGVIPRVVAEERAVMSGKLSMDVAVSRLNRFYHPYHNQLRDLLDASWETFGQVLLIDCHSMPQKSLTGMSGPMPDIVLGDRFGLSCGSHLVDEIESMLSRAGFHVVRNTPFAGAYITNAYGRPDSGRHCLQIEINRALYLNEKTITKTDQFTDIQVRLSNIVTQICNMTRWPMQFAAE